MKWSKKEINECIVLLQNGNNYDEIANKIGRTKKSVTVKLNRLNIYIKDYSDEVYFIKKECPVCTKEFVSYKSENRIYCSNSCSNSENNKLRKKCLTKKCINCGEDVKKLFCNLTCMGEYKKKEIYCKIKNGDVTLACRNYKNYLINQFGNKCMICGWNEKNTITGKSPIELDHIDGNSDNNDLDNLRLLCPNCHSLTPTYKALNKGNGRFKRVERRNQGKSF